MLERSLCRATSLLTKIQPGSHCILTTHLFYSTSIVVLISWTPSNPNSSAVNEIETNPGALQSFVVGSSGTLSPSVDTVSTGGAGPPFVNPLSSAHIAVVN